MVGKDGSQMLVRIVAFLFLPITLSFLAFFGIVCLTVLLVPIGAILCTGLFFFLIYAFGVYVYNPNSKLIMTQVR